MGLETWVRGTAAWAGWPAHNFYVDGPQCIDPTNNWPVCSLILRKISKIGAARSDACTKIRSLLYLRCLLLRGGRGRGSERRGVVRWREGAMKWNEGFGPPKNFGMVSPMSCDIVQLSDRVSDLTLLVGWQEGLLACKEPLPHQIVEGLLLGTDLMWSSSRKISQLNKNHCVW